MKYYLDTEFNSYGGSLISLALAREDNTVFYALLPKPLHPMDWIKDNVMPILESVPRSQYVHRVFPTGLQLALERFFDGDENPEIIVDWPDDIKYLSEALMTGPGTMIKIPRLTFRMHRIDAYPTNVVDAIQHNAYWDALALKAKCEELGLE